jgi:hypothetical protein
MVVRRIGQYETVAEAIAAAHKMIEDFLRREFQPGMDAKSLISLYLTMGEYPIIYRDDDKTLNVAGFNHVQYASTCAAEICGGKK